MRIEDVVFREGYLNIFIGHFTRNEMMQQLQACIGCQECLLACPTLAEPIHVNELNMQTYGAMITLPIEKFAKACTQCGACVSVCPVGLRRDAMMLWLKVRLSEETRRCRAENETGRWSFLRRLLA
jgi:ferredoxin